MKMVAPSGAMYQAGTLSGNPLAMTAGLATIRALTETGVFAEIEAKTSTLVTGLQAAAEAANVPVQANHVGTMFGFYFLKSGGALITDYASAKQHADTARYARFFHAMLEAGVYLAPSQFEAGFVSSAHTQDDIQATIQATQNVITR